MATQKQTSVWDQAKPFVFGGISGCTATTFIQPIDTVKVQVQIKGELRGLSQGAAQGAAQGSKVSVGVAGVISEVYASGGVKGFYKGLGSALLRQVLYATVRLGLYKRIADKWKAQQQKELSLFQKMQASAFSGFVGSLIGNPADLCLVRFQADSALPLNERRNYSNVFNALSRIVKEEGVVTLWRGSAPSVLRAMSMNLGMLTTYDEIKEMILRVQNRTKDTTADRLLASCGAGLVCSIMSLPFDNIKTKLQKMKVGADGLYPYKGVPDCLAKTVAREGFFGLWVGFPVYYSRVAPHAMIALLVQDALHAYSTKQH